LMAEFSSLRCEDLDLLTRRPNEDIKVIIPQM
jgi:hypothetical protein